jgi:hypothetical protein
MARKIVESRLFVDKPLIERPPTIIKQGPGSKDFAQDGEIVKDLSTGKDVRVKIKMEGGKKTVEFLPVHRTE